MNVTSLTYKQGVIPGGPSFQLTPPTGSNSFDWVANIKAGTSILWMFSDSQGRTGGSSDVKLVGVSDDDTCLSNNSPASLLVAPSHTTPLSSSPTSGSTTSSSTQSSPPASIPASGPNVALIAGVSIAGVFGLIAIVLVLIFLRRRERGGHHAHRVDLMDPPPGDADGHATAPISPYPFGMRTHGSAQAGSVAYGAHTPSPSSHNLLSDHGSEARGTFTNPYSAYNGMSSVTESTPRQSYHDEPTPYASRSYAAGPPAPSPSSYPPASPLVSSTNRSKTALAAQLYKPARIILHTDLEEAVPPDEGEEIIELPPQYSESRAPIRGLGATPVPDIALIPATPASPRPQEILR